MSLSDHYTTALDAMIAIANHYFYDGRLDDAVNILEQGTALLAYNDASQESQFNMLLVHASILSQQAWIDTGDYTQANDLAKKLEEWVVTPSQKGRLLGLQGNILRQQAMSNPEPDYETPRKLFEESLSLLNEKNEAQAYFWSLFGMGLCDQFMANYDSAMDCFQRANTIASEHDFKHELSYAMRHIGFVYQFTDRLDEGLAALQESLNLRKAIGFRLFLGLSHLAVANILHQLGKQNEAKAHYELAIGHCDEIGLVRSMMITRLSYGEVLVEYNDFVAAQSYLLQAESYAETIGHAGVLQEAIDLLGKISEPS